ncbi:MAG TPA: bifunctional 4-hydroxy-2-oxoglutarate aldolase/2-dehydro-3-deoxy-phosphogluconate aldolase [Arthrobacter sp.]
MFSPPHPAVASRPAPSQILLDTQVIAVLRAHHATAYAPVIEALLDGGVLSIELTLSTPGVFEVLPRLQERFGDGAEFGVGTITTVAEALRAIEAGAQYLVTPLTNPAIIAVAVEHGVAVFPGGLTPTELFSGWSEGATAVKVFPASVFGPGYVSMLRGPFPGIEVVPSGGVGIADAAAWIGAGALAVSLGGPLIGDAFHGGDLKQLSERAVQLRGLVDEARAAK